MKALVVYCHPRPASFNHAIMLAIADTLRDRKWEVEIADLYAMGFNPVLSEQDLAGFREGTYAPDITREHQRIRAADLIVVVHPIWWAGIPAMMKGYIDRVFSQGFAYVYEKGLPKGLLKGKRVAIFNTCGAPAILYRLIGMFRALRRTIGSGIYSFCGMKVVRHRFFGGLPGSTDVQRARMLETVQADAAAL